ncbi:MAG TPA: hypothetical protein VEU72_09005 [Nitrosopumilaceae archaeon]|nr:hypothetical protein [Nitrosopumilaceae archaeon]
MKLRYASSIFLCVLFFSLSGLNNALGTPSFSIKTDKTVYEYGDHLSIIFDVSELTGDPITIRIVDESGTSSSPWPIPITNLKTEITAPVAFYKTIYKSGTYHIDATYSGSNATTMFTLKDSNKIAIPSYDKGIIKLWSENTLYTDASFANVIREFIQYDIIHIPELNNQTTNSVHIPSWFKNDARWWSDDLISDNDFALGIQYLIESKIITV